MAKKKTQQQKQGQQNKLCAAQYDWNDKKQRTRARKQARTNKRTMWG